MIGPDPFFVSRSPTLAELALHHALPAIFDFASSPQPAA